MIPEFIGRLPVCATLEELDENMLIRIMKEPKNAIIKQFEVLFKMDNVELEIKHDALMDGYYKMEKETKETIIDGWLHTGDEGEIDTNGFLRITGRVKDLFKTSKGKYVAPSPIEMKLSANKNIEQVCVVGTELPQPIAIIVLSERGNNKSKEDMIFSLTTTLEVVNPKLDSHEKIHNIVVVQDDWSVANKLLTPTMKIKRNAIEKLYKKNYKLWYEGERVTILD